MLFKKVVNFPCKDLDQLYPSVKALAIKLVAEAKKAGIDIIVTQTYRSTEYQNHLYAQGRTEPGAVITNAKGGSSPHEFRVAFDIAIVEHGKVNWNTPNYSKVGALGEKLGLTWGGHFRTITDKPHFQYYGKLTFEQIKTGSVPV